MAVEIGRGVIPVTLDHSGVTSGLTSLQGLVRTKLGAAGLIGGAALATGIGAAVAGSAGLLKVGKSFDDMRDTIIKGTGASGKALRDLEKDALAVGKTTPSSFKDIGVAIADLSARTGATGKPLQTLASNILNLSRLTGTDLKTNIAAMTRLFGDWSIPTNKQSEALDKMFRASQTTGIGVDRLAQLMVQFGSPLRQLGLDFDFTAAMFSRFEKEGVNIQTAMPGLRMALKNFAKDGREPAPALMETFNAIRSTASVAEANTLAFEVFGTRAGPDLAAAIREGRFDLDKMINTIRHSKGAIEDADRRTRDFGESWQIIKNNILIPLKPIAESLFSFLADKAVAFADAMPGMIEKVQEFVGKIKDVFSGGGSGGFGASVGKTFEAVRSAVVPIIEDIIAFVRDNWPKIEGFIKDTVNTISGILQDFAALVKKVWANFGDDILAVIKIVFETVGDIIGGALKVIGGIIKVATGLISGDWGKVWDGITDIFGGVWKAISGLVEGALKLIRTIIGAAWEWVRDRTKERWEEIKEKVSGVWDGIKEKVGNAVDAVKEKLGNVWDAIKEKVGNIWDAIKEKIGNVWDGIKEAVGNKIDAVKEKLGNVWDAIKEKAGNIWDGIKEKISDVLGKIKDGIDTAVTKIGNAWDGLKKAAAQPVNFVIEWVWNKGIVPLVNGIPGVGSPLSTMGKIAFAKGGVLPGFTPGRDVHRFISPTGGRLDLSGGEAIMRPEFTRAVGGRRGVDRLNRAARRGELGALHPRVTREQASRLGGILQFFLGGVMPAPRATEITRHSGYPWAIWAGDLNVPGSGDSGDPVVAWRAGTVASKQQWSSSYGWHYRVNHPATNQETLYAHLSGMAVSAGQKVGAGQRLGSVGMTGNASGPHLHFELKGGMGGVNLGDTGGGAAAPVIPSWVTSLAGGIKDLLGRVGGWVSSLGNMGEWGGYVRGIVPRMIGTLKDWLLDKVPSLTDIVGAVKDVLVDAWQGLTSIFDHGGILKPGRLALNRSGRPERVLDPRTTENFERLTQALVTAPTLRAQEAVAAAASHERPDQARATERLEEIVEKLAEMSETLRRMPKDYKLAEQQAKR